MIRQLDMMIQQWGVDVFLVDISNASHVWTKCHIQGV